MIADSLTASLNIWSEIKVHMLGWCTHCNVSLRDTTKEQREKVCCFLLHNRTKCPATHHLRNCKDYSFGCDLLGSQLDRLPHSEEKARPCSFAPEAQHCAG